MEAIIKRQMSADITLVMTNMFAVFGPTQSIQAMRTYLDQLEEQQNEMIAQEIESWAM